MLLPAQGAVAVEEADEGGGAGGGWRLHQLRIRRRQMYGHAVICATSSAILPTVVQCQIRFYRSGEFKTHPQDRRNLPR